MSEFCPFIKGKCKKAECKLWIHLLGKNPQGSDTFDTFDCSMAFLPILLVENAQMSRQTSAAVESFRNGVVEGIKQIAVLNHNQGLLGGNGADPT